MKKHVLSDFGKEYAFPVFATLVDWQLQNQHIPIHAVTGTSNKPVPQGQVGNGLLRVMMLEQILQDETASQVSISKVLKHGRMRIKSGLDNLQDQGLLDIRLATGDNQKCIRIESSIQEVSTNGFARERRVATDLARRLGEAATPLSVDDFVAQVVSEYPDIDKEQMHKSVIRNLTAGVWRGLSFVNSENYTRSKLTITPEYLKGIQQLVAAIVTLRQPDPNTIDRLEERALDIVGTHAIHGAFARYAYEQAAIARYSDQKWSSIVQNHKEDGDTLESLHRKIVTGGYPIGRKKLQGILEKYGY